MILDAYAYLADAITVGSSTAAVVTTSYIDTIAAGDDYAGTIANFLCETAVLSGTAGATVTFNVLHCDTTVASAFTTLVSSGAIDDATAVAGYRYATRLPISGIKRYIMGNIVTSQVTTSGTVSVFITKDSDVNAQLIA